MRVKVSTFKSTQYGNEVNSYYYNNVIRIINGFEYDGKEKPVFRLVMLKDDKYSTATFWAENAQIDFE